MSGNGLEEEFEEILRETKIEVDWASKKRAEAESSIRNRDKRNRMDSELGSIKDVAEIQEKILDHVKKGNYWEAFKLFENLVQKQSSIDYQSIYQDLISSEIATEEETEKILKMQERSEYMERDLLKKVKEASKSEERSSYRPVVAIQEEVLGEVYAKMDEISSAEQTEKSGFVNSLLGKTKTEYGKEFSGLMGYRRTNQGIEVENFSVNDDKSRVEDDVDWGQTAKEKLSNSAGNKIIGFHSHPVNDKGSRLSPSAKDINFKKNRKTGIAVVGYATPEFMRPEKTKGLFAFSIRRQDNDESDTWMYLPINVVSGNRDVTDQHSEIKLYNKAVQKSIENNDFALSNEKRGLKLEEYMRNIT